MTASTLPGKEEGFSPPCLLNIMTSIGLHIHLTSKRSLVGSREDPSSEVTPSPMQILSLLYLCSPHCFTTYVQVRLSHQWGIHVNYKMMFSISLYLIFPLSSKDKYKADNVLCCFFPPSCLGIRIVVWMPKNSKKIYFHEWSTTFFWVVTTTMNKTRWLEKPI